MHAPLLRLAPALVTVGLLLAACGADRTSPASPPGGSSGSTSAPAAVDRLEVRYDAGDGSPPQTWTLTCSPPGGTHPDPAGACADLAAAADPFAPRDPDLLCTEVYGGPQTAHVTGTWAARPVEASFDRVDGCGISRWDALGRLLPPPDSTALQPPV